MQPSAASNRPSNTQVDPPGLTFAVITEILFLLNILFLPGIAFVILLGLYLCYRNHPAPLARCHLRQTFFASIWAGVILILVNGLIIFFGGYNAPSTWIIVILYFTTIHATLILLGTFGMTRAMNGKHFHYPLIGGACIAPEIDNDPGQNV